MGRHVTAETDAALECLHADSFLQKWPLLEQQPLVSGQSPTLVSSVETGPGAGRGQEVAYRPSHSADSD